MRKKLSIAIVVVVAAVFLAAVALSGFDLNLSSQATPGKSVVQTAQDNKNLTTFNGALNASGLDDTLNGTGPYTVFAPTDTAFSAMNQTELDNLTGNNASLAELLQYHVVSGKYTWSQLVNNLSLTTLEGGNVAIVQNETGTYVNDAKIEANGTEASNGMVYTIDKVLMPQTLVETVMNTSSLSSLYQAMNMTQILGPLNGSGPFTLFAPSNSALANSSEVAALIAANDTINLTRLLAYHVVPFMIVDGNGTNSSLVRTAQGSDLVMTVNASGMAVNGIRVTTSNLIATNGVVHIIDGVLTPPQSIAQTIMANTSLSGLSSAISTANLTSSLNGTTPYTVFAPTDAAFSALDQEVLSRLTSSDRTNLTKLLTYHVVPGTVASFQLSNGTLTTLEGEQLNVTVNGTTITVGNVTLVMTDIICTNGIIHIIDQVLVPPSMNMTAVASASTAPMGQATVSSVAPAGSCAE